MTLRPVQWIRFAAGLVITSVFLWLALRHVRLDGIALILRHVRWLWLAIALVALACGYSVRVYRWWWMLHACNPEVKFGSCVGPFLTGFAINNVMPFRAGDAARVFGFTKQLATPVVRLLGSLLLERSLDLTILLVFLFLGILSVRGDAIPAMYLRTVALVAAVVVLGWGMLLFIGDRLEAYFLRLCRLRVVAVYDRHRRAEHHVGQLFSALNIVRTTDHALKLLGLSVIVWSCEGGVFAAVANSLNYDGRPFGPWFALATGTLSTLIPSSPGYVGTFDFFTRFGLMAYGADASAATATAFIVHAVLWLPLTAAGLIYLLMLNISGRRSRPVESGDEDGGHTRGLDTVRYTHESP